MHKGCQATSGKHQTNKPLMAVAFRKQLFTALTGSTLCEADLAFVWMKSNSQLLVLAFDGQGIYTRLHLHWQHAVIANQHGADKRSTGRATCHKRSLP